MGYGWVAVCTNVHISEAEPPIVNHPSDIKYVVGDTGYNVTWLPEDAYPDHYEIFINETIYESGDWNGSEILVLVDGYDVGVYNFTLVVYDVLGQKTIDTVFVGVLTLPSDPPPDYFGTILFFLGIGAVGFIITFSILYTSTPFLKRFRRKSDSEDGEGEEIRTALEGLKTDADDTLDKQNNDDPLDLDGE
ncbi:MAG: hypothetical protein ACTSSE_01405 [Candidatus Thorarchaeota archaeon]